MDILDEARVDAGALDETAEDTGEEILCGGIFEAAAAALGKCGAEGAGYYYVVRVLFGETVPCSGSTGGELVCDLGEAGGGWGVLVGCGE